MKGQIVIYTGFNCAMFPVVGEENGIHKSLTDGWIKYRADIWKKYTLKSILNQTYQNWVYCIRCNKAAKRITDYYLGDVKDPRVRIVYPETPQERKVMGRIAKGKDEIVCVRVDSDDMYHPKAIEELVAALNNDSRNWFIWRNGYCYQYNEKRNPRMKVYNPKGSGPFFAHRFTKKEWLDNGIIAIKCQHQHVRKHRPMNLPGSRVMVGITGTNSTTLFKNNCFKKMVKEPEKTKVLKEFGIL